MRSALGSRFFLSALPILAVACAGGELDSPVMGGGGAAGAAASGGAAGASAGTGGTAGAAGKGGAGAGGGTAGTGGGGAGGASAGLGLETAPAAKTLASLTLAESAADVVTAGPFAFTVGAKSVRVLDLSTPSAPKQGATIATAGKVLAAEHDDATGTVFFADDTGTVTAVRLLTADAPTQLAAVTTSAGPTTRGMARVGKRLVLLAGATLLPVDVGDGGTLTPATPTTIAAGATQIAAGGGDVFVGFTSGAIESWALPKGAAGLKRGSFAGGGEITGLVAKGSKVVALAKGLGLRVADFGDPTKPAALYLDTELADATSGRIAGRALVVGLARGYVTVLDLSDAAAPRAVTTNKGITPAWVQVVDGNVVFGSGTTATVASVPPFVAGRVPAVTAASFPRYGGVPVTFDKPLDPATVSAQTVKLSCDGKTVEGAVVLTPERTRLAFRPTTALPASATCVLSFAGVRDAQGNAVSAPGGSGDVTLKTTAEEPAPFVNPKSAYPHTADGGFTDYKGGAGGSYEWFDVKPAKGMYTYFYADFDGSKLWLLNDWFYDGDQIEPDCYNRFQVWTGGGAEQWEIRAYGDRHVEVMKNGAAVDPKAGTVAGGFFYGPSPNVAAPHTQYELSIAAAPGAWGVQLHDPGPAFQCKHLESETMAVTGSTQSAATEVDPTHKLVIPAAPKAGSPQNGASGVATGASFAWSSSDAWTNFDAYRIVVARDAALTAGRYESIVTTNPWQPPAGLLQPATTYYWAVTATNTMGQTTSTVSSFTTAGGQGGQGGAAGAGGAGGAAGSAGSGAGGSGGSGAVCAAVNEPNAPAQSTMGTKSIGMKHTTQAALAVSGLEVFTSGSGKEQYLAVFSDAQNQPGVELSGGTFTADKAAGWYGVKLAKTVQLQPGATYWIVWHPENGGQSNFAVEGTPVTYRGSDDMMIWDGPYTGALRYRLDCAGGGQGGAGGASGAGGSGAGAGTGTGGSGAGTGTGGAGGASACDAGPFSPAQGLAAYYKLDEASGDACDASGNGHHGKPEGMIKRGVSGKVGTGVMFTNGAFRVPASPGLDMLTSGTIEAWVNLAETAGVGQIAGRGTGDNDDNVLLITSCGNVNMTYTHGATVVGTATKCGALTAGTWAHVAVVHDGATVSIYVDGNLVTTTAGSTTALGALTSDLVLGRREQGIFPLIGTLDEVKWWTIALDQAAICDHAGGTWNGASCTTGF